MSHELDLRGAHSGVPLALQSRADAGATPTLVPGALRKDLDQLRELAAGRDLD